MKMRMVNVVVRQPMMANVSATIDPNRFYGFHEFLFNPLTKDIEKVKILPLSHVNSSASARSLFFTFIACLQYGETFALKQS